MALDTTERDRFEAQLKEERAERARLEEALAQASMQVQLLKVELDALKGDLKRSKRRKLAAESETGRAPLKFTRRCIIGSGSGYACRSVCFDAHYGHFLVIRNDAGSGQYGVVKVSFWDANASEFVILHDGPIRALAASPHNDGMWASVGEDGAVKLATAVSNSVVQTWRLPEGLSAWSVCFHPGNRHWLGVGLSGGKIGLIDIRSREGTAWANIINLFCSESGSSGGIEEEQFTSSFH